MNTQDSTPGKFFFGFLAGLSVMIVLRFLFVLPFKKEREEVIRHFLLYPDKYEIHEIYRDSALVNYEIICK